MAVKKNKMDPAMQAKLAGLLPATSTFLVNFTPKMFEQVEEEYRPVFVLKPFTQHQVKEIAKFVEKSGSNEEYVINKVRAQMISWSNLIDVSTGDAIKFEELSGGGCSKDQWELLPTHVQAEIVTELLRISGVKQ